jgi:hypothetical protein
VNAKLESLLKAFDASVGLRPLNPSSRDRFQVWNMDYMLGTLTGYFVTGSNVRKCTTHADYKNGAYIVRSGHCGAMRKLRQPADMLQAVHALAEFNGKQLSCVDVMDGGITYVEGLDSGTMFAVSYANASFCNDQMAQRVDRVERLLM